jgi:hypothetical protein
MDTDCPRMTEPALPSFDDQDVDAPATQFDRKQHSDRTAADDHHFMIWFAIHHSATPLVSKISEEHRKLSPETSVPSAPENVTSS